MLEKLAKKYGAIACQRDIEQLWNFYISYKRWHRVDDIQKEQQILLESTTFSTTNLGEYAMILVYAQYGTLTGKLTNILNRHDTWYYSCKGCNKKVGKYIYDKCQNCQHITEDGIPRYVVKIIVEDETDSARVTLFDAAETLIGCKAQKFIADIKEAQYGTLTGKLTNILNRHDTWYYSCKGCNKKVGKYIYDKCQNCQHITEDGIPRYVVKIIVEDETDSARVTLFDAAETLIGCKAQKFIADIKENNQSSFFQKFVLNIGKIYKFLGKLDENSKDERAQGKIIAQEIKIQEDIAINIDDDDVVLELPKKKIKVENE
ncbi:uncharacterized protein LOC109838035 isoform X2 [Asparagus officinalis]|uniref:uncharacterized protein LOC109838035 isoform X2 n=1 Tax=Asparagus officinalis TaxID=4686 RepID=UPI00098E809B|nr:uncharacterized protein LOC109838035 isoform X2 [Asparagus officinalis]